jgi:hypothetical protein
MGFDGRGGTATLTNLERRAPGVFVGVLANSWLARLLMATARAPRCGRAEERICCFPSRLHIIPD